MNMVMFSCGSILFAAGLMIKVRLEGKNYDYGSFGIFFLALLFFILGWVL